MLHYMFCFDSLRHIQQFFQSPDGARLEIKGLRVWASPVALPCVYHWAHNFICLPGFVPIHLPTDPPRGWLGGLFPYSPEWNYLSPLLYPKHKIHLVPTFPKPLDGPQECLADSIAWSQILRKINFIPWPLLVMEIKK